MREVRIGIIGCGGVGKSILGRTVASRLGVPFLEAKQTTEEILVRDGYDYGSGLAVEKFLAGKERQREIMDEMWESHSVGSFVTDRTFVDLAAYVAVEMNEGRGDEVSPLVERCRKATTDRYTDLFLCPWKPCPPQDNRRRTLNQWYQFVVHGADLAFLREWDLDCHIVEAEDTENRVEEVLFDIG